MDHIELMQLHTLSNTIDNEVGFLHLQSVLRGVDKQGDVGLLSLFEHYGSCQVRSLRQPSFDSASYREISPICISTF